MVLPWVPVTPSSASPVDGAAYTQDDTVPRTAHGSGTTSTGTVAAPSRAAPAASVRIAVAPAATAVPA